MSLISIRGLRKAYGTLSVLHEIDLEIAEGEFVSVVGQSGCGKSTLLYAIAGFVGYEGEIRRPEKLGVVFQDHALYPFMTVAANISLGLHAIPRKQRRPKVDEFLDVVGMRGYGAKYPWQLSGGESQRISIARAFAIGPTAALLDEPFSALDIMRREAMAEWLVSFLARRPTTVVFVTHWIDEAILLSDRIVAMSGGRIVDDFLVGFDRPRRDHFKADPRFVSLRNEIRQCIFDHEIKQPDTSL